MERCVVTVYLVGAGPGDPGLVTVRGADVIASADVVVHDRLVDPALLDLAPLEAERIDVGKVPGKSRSQGEISSLLVDLAERYGTVVRLKGGDPFVFGRGGEELEALLKAGVKVEVVPGVTSAFAAPAYAGVPVTHRGLSTSVTVVTGHVGDPDAPGSVDWGSLARAGGTLVVMMGMAKRSEIADAVIRGGRDPATAVAVVEWGTTPRQRTVRTTLAELGRVELGSPATIVIGAVADLELSWLERPPLSGWTVVVTRPKKKAASLSGALRSVGASVVSLPSIAVVGPRDGGKALAGALSVVGGYDWIAFTSSNAVERFLSGIRDVRQLAGVKLAAVGTATAAALRRGHLVADLVSVRPSAAGLVESMGKPPTGATVGGRVLFCRAADALPTLAEGLRAAGWTVDEVEAYATELPTPRDGATRGNVERARGADAVVFASPSAVRGFVSLLSHEGVPQVAVCIGETTAAEARESGFAHVAISQSANDEGLVAAVLAARLRS